MDSLIALIRCWLSYGRLLGQSPQIQIDYIMPYMGTAGQLMAKVCAYLSKPDPQIEVWPNLILNRSTESTASGKLSVIL